MIARVVNVRRCENLEAKRLQLVGMPYKVLGYSGYLSLAYLVEGSVGNIVVCIHEGLPLRIYISLRCNILVSAVSR